MVWHLCVKMSTGIYDCWSGMDIVRRAFDEPQWCHIEPTDGRTCFGLVSEKQAGDRVFLRVDYCTEPGSKCEVSRLMNVDLVVALVLADSVREMPPPDVPEARTGKNGRDAPNPLGNLVIGDFGNIDPGKVPF